MVPIYGATGTVRLVCGGMVVYDTVGRYIHKGPQLRKQPNQTSVSFLNWLNFTIYFVIEQGNRFGARVFFWISNH